MKRLDEINNMWGGRRQKKRVRRGCRDDWDKAMAKITSKRKKTTSEVIIL